MVVHIDVKEEAIAEKIWTTSPDYVNSIAQIKKKNERYKNILLIVKIKQHIELQNIHHMIRRFFFENVELFFITAFEMLLEISVTWKRSHDVQEIHWLIFVWGSATRTVRPWS